MYYCIRRENTAREETQLRALLANMPEHRSSFGDEFPVPFLSLIQNTTAGKRRRPTRVRAANQNRKSKRRKLVTARCGRILDSAMGTSAVTCVKRPRAHIRRQERFGMRCLRVRFPSGSPLASVFLLWITVAFLLRALLRASLMFDGQISAPNFEQTIYDGKTAAAVFVTELLEEGPQPGRIG